MSTSSEKNDRQLSLNLIKDLKSDSKTEICSSLTLLKRDSKCQKQFVLDGGLLLLVQLFHSDSLKILDLLLSVLANMCLHTYVRIEFRSRNPASEVTNLLKNNKSQSIQCRACRLIGNLAECSWHARALCQAGVVRIITNVLKSAKTIRRVQITAVRAIRNIWSSTKSSREEILEVGTFREITTIFVLTNEKKEEKSNQELIHVCLKAMLAFVQSSDPRCGSQLQEGFKCLEVMLGILKRPEHDRYHPMLLHALAQFIYDDPSILKMIKNGLLDVLIMKLQEMTAESTGDDAERYVTKKRSASSPLSHRTETKFNRSEFGRYSLDYKQGDWSPGSARSMCSSPPSTPPLQSFFEDDTNKTDSSAEENYSPVCSDTECAENDEDDEVESTKSCSSIILESAAESNDFGDAFKMTTMRKQADIWTLSLLSRLSHSDEPVDKLADPAMIQPLIAYIRTTKNSRASRILARIIRNRAYLVTLLKQGFIFELQTMRGSEQYTRQLCALAETGCALGELASILLRGQETHKFIIAVSIPYLIQSKDSLRILLKTHDGLTLVFRVLADKRHCLHVNAIHAVCRLANALDIRPELVDRSQGEGVARIDYAKNLENHLKPAIVTFELDNGTTVDAYRYILCQKSEVFSAMLEGNFYESGKRRVHLKNTSKEGLDTLLLAVNGMPYNERNIESLLDAVLLADKFLMPDILESLIERSLLNINFQNISRTWHWARTNSCHELRLGCIKIFLTAKSTKPEKLDAFEDFSKSEHFSLFIDDVEQVLKTGLSCH
ncbi:armadillo repeat-containing protein 5 isoform X2 [Neodiprion pinetum]|uniref:armadillo repeat-containing protein 5 isoform X2 n=1 Tax=Neodiprion pinetum TaxID=441929 RepID=UPI0037231B2B